VSTSRWRARRRTVLATAPSLALALALTLPGCARDLELPPPPAGPALTGLDPSAAFAGELIEVAGRGFAADPAGNAVVFPGATARGERLTATGLVVRVPPDAGSGELRVTSDGGTSAPVAGFRYLGLGQLRVGKVVTAQVPVVHQPRLLLADGDALYLHSGLLDGLVQAGEDFFMRSCPLSTIPGAAGGALFWIGEDGLLHRRDTATGVELEVTAAAAGLGALSLTQLVALPAGPLVAVGSDGSGTVLAPLDPATLLPVSAGLQRTFALGLDSAVAALPGGRLAAVAQPSGGGLSRLRVMDLAGTFITVATPRSIPAVGIELATGTLGAQEVIAVTTANGTFDVVTTTGAVVRSDPALSSTPVSALAIAGGLVVAARTDDGTVVATDLASGTGWGLATPRPTRLAVAGGVVWVASDANDVLVALDAATGALLAHRGVAVGPGSALPLGGLALSGGRLTMLTAHPGARVDFTLPDFTPTGESTPFHPTLIAADPDTGRLWIASGAFVSTLDLAWSTPVAVAATVQRMLALDDGLAVVHDTGLAWVSAAGAVHELVADAFIAVALASDRNHRLLYAATVGSVDTLMVFAAGGPAAGAAPALQAPVPGLTLGAVFVDDQPWAFYYDAGDRVAARLDTSGTFAAPQPRRNSDNDSLPSPNRRTLITWDPATVPGATGALQVWSADPSTRFAPLSSMALPANVSGLAFDPTGERLYVVTRDPDLLLVVE
jgi:outer membrane protein assembly factor BamB